MDRTAPVGSELGGYRIERLLGRGGMGSVYLAEHVRLKRKVALKVLAPELAEDERFRERFIRESELAASLDHPNVLPIYEAGEQDGVLFIAMRYVDGMDLETLLEQQGRLDPDRTATLVGQVASALDAAHENGLVHRDVKPGNILLARATDPGSIEHIYLSDFGLTKRAASDSGLTGTGVFVGTLNYAAPEQFEGGPLDARTDVYSLGCVVFECLTGAIPFRKEQDAALLHAHLHEPPPKVSALRPELPPGVDNVVAKAMAKRPDKRYQRAGDLAAGLRDVVVGDRTAGPGRPRRGARGWFAAAVAVGALVASIAVFALTRGDDAPDGLPSPTSSPTGLVPGEAPPPGSLANIDPETGAISLTVPDVTGLKSTRLFDPYIAVGEGGVWLYGFEPNSSPSRFRSVSHIDPNTGEGIRIPVQAFFGGGTALAVGSQTVWFIGEAEDRVSRINPATDQFLDPVSIRSGVVTDMVLGGGALWVGVSDGTLIELDPLTGRLREEIDLGATPDELAFGAGSVWALDQIGGQVLQIDPDDGRVVERIEVVGNFKDVAAGDGGVWVLDDFADTVTQIDPRTGAVHDPIAVGPAPSAIAVGLGSAWITDEEEGRIYRVDPQLGTQEPVEVGAPAIAIAIDDVTNSLWLATLDTES